MRFYLGIGLWLVIHLATAQQKFDTPPFYKDGTTALKEYIKENAIYPEKALENGIDGWVVLTFDVDTTGAISNIVVKDSLGWGLDEEAVRVLQNLPQAFEPGTLNGEKVKLNVGLPVYFVSGNRTKSDLERRLDRLKQDSVKEFSEYQPILFEAVEYMLTHAVYGDHEGPINVLEQFNGLNPDFEIPIESQFFEDLEYYYSQLYYVAAMVRYILKERLENNRNLDCLRGESNYLDQADVQEVQLEAAKVYLDYADYEWNAIPMNKVTKKYLRAHKRDKLTIEKLQYGF